MLRPRRSIFREPCFSSCIFVGLNATQDNTSEEALSKEGYFMSQLILQLLNWQRSGELFNSGLYDFYTFCQQHLSRSHAQILQDLWVLHMLKEKRDDFFVEFGACDVIELSNTLLLEQDYCWTGILAEPDPFWHTALAENRSCCIAHGCVTARSGERIAFAHIPAMPELSRMRDIVPADVHEKIGNRAHKEEIEVETISLLELLRAYGAPQEIDYPSIDTEVSEFTILEAFDFTAYTFHLISVEHAGETEKREGVVSSLEAGIKNHGIESVKVVKKPCSSAISAEYNP